MPRLRRRLPHELPRISLLTGKRRWPSEPTTDAASKRPSVRDWHLNAVTAALLEAFPKARVYVSRSLCHSGYTVACMVHPRERVIGLSRRYSCDLSIAAEVLGACKDRSEVSQLIAGVVPKMERGTMV